MQGHTFSTNVSRHILVRPGSAWNASAWTARNSLHTAVTALAPSSSDSGTSDEEEDLDLDEENEEESEQWKQFRDVGDGSDDDDVDHVDAKVPTDRYVLPADVRKKGASALRDEETENLDADQSPASLPIDADGVPQTCVPIEMIVQSVHFLRTEHFSDVCV